MFEIGKTKSIRNKIYFAELIVAKIRDDIVNGRLRPNERLVEADIAGKMKISRTPVREAFRTLEMQGYLSRLPNGGLVVTDHSPSQIRNLFELREALETMALKLACQRVTEDEIERAKELHERIFEAVRKRDVNSFTELNGAFHDQLLSACRNERLWSLIQNMRDQYFYRRIARVFNASDWRLMIKQHQRLLDAVSQRNPRRVEKAVHEHIATSLKIAVERL